MKTHTPNAARHAIGWHGKLPTVGDFATRRLDANFVSVWDDWLSGGLASLRTHNPDHWLDAYLASPTWRFVAMPGFLPAPLHAGMWAGVVMPSVDKVGRYYPLTLAAPLSALPAENEAQIALWVWLQGLEDAAIDALQEDWSIDLLETELLRMGLPPEPEPGTGFTGPGRPGKVHGLNPAVPASREAFFAACLVAGPNGQGQCLWYNEADISAPGMLCSPGLDGSIARLWQA